MVSALPLQAQIYGVSFEASAWKTTAGPFVCRLTHEIPQYGVGVFERKSRQTETFSLQQGTPKLALGVVTVAAVPPPWRADLGQQPLAQIQAVAGKKPVNLNAAQAAALTTQLNNGMRIMFSGSQQNGGVQGVFITLEPNKFAAAYKKYTQCVANLIPYRFQQLARVLLSYPAQATALSSSAKTELDKIARYAKADAKVLGIIVDAHAEQLEDEQAAVDASKQQAEWVTQYLVSKGIKAEQITTRWHGDEFPIATNSNDAGRAKNRRVTLRLESAETRLATAKKLAALKAAALAAQQSSSVSSIPAPLPSALERLVNMVDEQDLTSGKMPQIHADDLR